MTEYKLRIDFEGTIETHIIKAENLETAMLMAKKASPQYDASTKFTDGAQVLDADGHYLNAHEFDGAFLLSARINGDTYVVRNGKGMIDLRFVGYGSECHYSIAARELVMLGSSKTQGSTSVSIVEDDSDPDTETWETHPYLAEKD
jgi:hypothetical protein